MTSTRIIVRREDEEADARSLMDLMMLGAASAWTSKSKRADPMPQEALDAIEALIAAKFHEEQ